MENNALQVPITCEERYLTLHLYYDLTEEAKKNAFSLYDESSDAQWHMDGVYEELALTHEWIEKQAGINISLCSMHGPGTERYIPSRENDVFNGWGTLREFSPLPENAWSDCYQLDALEAWNRHAGKLQYLYNKLENLDLWELGDLNCGSRFLPAMSYDWYLSAYENTLQDALQAVCDALNNIEDAESDYTNTQEFFEYNYLDISDSEHWYTADGMRELVRDSTQCEFVDEGTEADVIYECNSPHVLFVREYLA